MQNHSEIPADFLSQRQVAMRLPIQLDPRVYDYLAERAQHRGITVAEMVNEVLKKSIELSWKLAA